MTLRIPRPLYDQLRKHGEQTYPYECCGVLVGELDRAKGSTVKAVFPCSNALGNLSQKRYLISPSELVRIQGEATLAGCNIVGFYHSHPDIPAQWSATDLAGAQWTGCSYVITSIERGRATVTNSFLLQRLEDTMCFEEEDIHHDWIGVSEACSGPIG